MGGGGGEEDGWKVVVVGGGYLSVPDGRRGLQTTVYERGEANQTGE